MIAVRDYRPGDLDRVARQPMEMGDPQADARAPDLGPTFTVTRRGRPILVAGLAEAHAGYASAWARIGRDLGGDYPAVARAVRRVLDACGYARVDVMVRDDWRRAHDLVRLLGFTFEGVMRRAGPRGEDFAIYARVRDVAEGGIR